MSLVKLLGIFLLMSFAAEKNDSKARSKGKSVCDSNTVTRNCDFFRERASQRVITLADGSTFYNPLFVDPQKPQLPNLDNPPGGGIGGNGYIGGMDYDKLIYNQSEIIDALESTSFSTRFKMMYAGQIAGLALVPDQAVEIPWPPTDKDAKKQSIKPAEIEAYIKKNLSAEDWLRHHRWRKQWRM
ncbi:MAG TPA: hypothetical protein VIG33_04545 [Pseudobdellovibrionaceae bacterium]|jgi:hypothetical protein